MWIFLAAGFAAMVLFPTWSALALGRLIERLDRRFAWACPVLVLLNCLVWRVILRDAERYRYDLILSGLWREWFGY